MYEDVLFAMFPDATEHIRLKEMLESRFAKAQLKVARTNVFNETNIDQAATEEIKSMSGGDQQSGDVKNQRDRERWRPFTQLIFDSNSVPRFKDPTYGFKRRFTRVKMPYTFVDNPDPKNEFERKADQTLGERLVAEENLSGILNLIMARAPEIIKDREICRRERDFDEYEEDSYSFTNFVEQFIEVNQSCREDREYQISSDALYACFEKFTSFGGSKMSRFSFSKKIGDHNKHPSEAIHGEDFGSRYRGFKGLRFKEAEFREYVKQESYNIAHGIDSSSRNDTGTSRNELGTSITDTGTSGTSYTRVIANTRDKTSKTCVYTDKIETPFSPTRSGEAAHSGNDLLDKTPKNDNSEPNFEPGTDHKDELVPAKNGDQKQEAEVGKKTRQQLFMARITMESEYKGVIYKAGTMMTSAVEVRCTKCGNVINYRGLITKDGKCEVCYYKELGLSKDDAKRFGGEDGTVE
jgi:hypothetical protein